MSKQPDYLKKHPKSGIWYARLRVPRDVAGVIGRDEFSKSLETREERLARKKIRAVLVGWEREIEEARRKPDLSTADVETLARYYYHQQEQADLAERDKRPIAAQKDAWMKVAVGRLAARSCQSGANTDPFKALDLALDEISNLDLTKIAQEHRRICAIGSEWRFFRICQNPNRDQTTAFVTCSRIFGWEPSRPTLRITSQVAR